MPAETLIGIDIGTTAVKAVMVETGGRVVAEYAAPYRTARPRPGQVEQDPEDWLRLALRALDTFAALDLAGVRGIGLTGQVNTHVFLDAALRPVRPAIVWQDARAAAEAAALDATVSADEKLAWFGAPMPLDASHALSRMAWVAAHEPDAWATTAHVLAPKDFLLARLTGVVAADPIASVGLVGGDLGYVAPLLARVDGAARRLAPLADPLAAVGRVRDGLPCAGVPVTLGTMDAWAGMFGVGVASPGEAMYLSGTSEVLGLIAPVRAPTPGVIVFPAWRGLVVQMAPTQAGGASLEWLAQLLGRSPAELAAAATGEIGAASPLFLPHLEGERAPLWDAGARGAFAGLTTGSDDVALCLAVMEGVAFSARLAFEALEASADLRAPLLRAGGGGMQSDRWCRLRADVFGRPHRRMASRYAAALGAAVCAGVGSGATGSLAEAAGLVRPDATFDPGPGAALADERFATWREFYAQIRPINARLGGVPGRTSEPLTPG
ncbi:MAG: FGGY family carbohydrate kinase [Amaricoccus sp.]